MFDTDLGINLFGSYNLHLVMTKLSSWKRRIMESIGCNSSLFNILFGYVYFELCKIKQ